jgi:hypothetical protein
MPRGANGGKMVEKLTGSEWLQGLKAQEKYWLYVGAEAPTP